jgi:hypothetical protein
MNGQRLSQAVAERVFGTRKDWGAAKVPTEGEPSRCHFDSLLVASLVWTSYRNHASSADPAKAVTAGSSTPSSMSQETAHIVSSGSEGLSNAQSAIMFFIAPLTSLSVMTTQVDPDPVTSFRNLLRRPILHVKSLTSIRAGCAR